MLKRLLPTQISPLGDNEVEVVMSSGDIARDGHVLVPQGCELGSYSKNAVVLWQHDASQPPIARASDIRVSGNSITAKITFPPRGISPRADEIHQLVRESFINSVSVGFDPIDGGPLDPKKPRGGQRFSRWELLELSFVNVPSDVNAVVTARELERDDMTERLDAARKDVLDGIITPNEARAAEGLPPITEERDDATPLSRLTRAIDRLRDYYPSDNPDTVVASIVEDLAEAEAALKREAEPEATRAGAKHSAATKAALQEAIGHHEAGIQCMRDMMDSDGGDDSGEMSHAPAGTRMVDTLSVAVDASDLRRALLRERINLLKRKAA